MIIHVFHLAEHALQLADPVSIGLLAATVLAPIVAGGAVAAPIGAPAFQAVDAQSKAKEAKESAEQQRQSIIAKKKQDKESKRKLEQATALRDQTRAAQQTGASAAQRSVGDSAIGSVTSPATTGKTLLGF